MPTLPYDTSALIKQTKNMLKQTAEQGTTAFAGSSYDTNRTGAVPAITPASMTPTTPVQVETTPTTPVPVVSPYEPVLTEPEKQAETQRTGYQDLIAQLTAETSTPFQEDARLKAEQAQGIADKKAKLATFQNQQKALQAEAEGIQLQLAQTLEAQKQGAVGQGITAGGLAPHLRASQVQANQQLLSNAIKQFSNNASLAASQGDLASALDYVDRAIQAEFLPKEKALAVAQANLTNLQNSGVLKRADQKRADARQKQLDAEKEALATEKANKTFIRDLMLKAQVMGADQLTLRAIESSATPEEAIRNAGDTFAPAPAKRETQVVKLDNGTSVLLDTQTGETIRTLSGGTVPQGSSVVTTTDGQTVAISPDAQQWVTAINNGSVSLDEALTKIGSTAKSLTLKNEIMAGINAQGGQTETKLNQMKQNVGLIDDILGGDFEYFGASVAPRSVFGFKVNPYYNSFKAKVDNLVASLTVDNLGLLKGPMSDKDIEFVKQLSSGLDINMDEKTAKTRLEQIRARLSEKIQNATPENVSGVLRSPDGSQEVNMSDLTPQELQEAKDAGWK